MIGAARHGIEAERLVLRELGATEASSIMDGRTPPGQTWATGYPLPGTTVAARMFVRLCDAGGYQAGFGMYQIVERAGGRVIGDIGFHSAPDEAGSVEIGYGLVPEYRGAGLATEAAVALTGWALRQDAVREITAETELDHRASQWVLIRAGFTERGADAESRHFVLKAED